MSVSEWEHLWARLIFGRDCLMICARQPVQEIQQMEREKKMLEFAIGIQVLSFTILIVRMPLETPFKRRDLRLLGHGLMEQINWEQQTQQVSLGAEETITASEGDSRVRRFEIECQCCGLRASLRWA